AFGAGFQVFDVARAGGGQVRAVRAPGCAGYSRREVDELAAVAKQRGAKGLATLAYTDDGPKGPIVKFFDDDSLQRVKELTEAENGDLVLIVADQAPVVAEAL